VSAGAAMMDLHLMVEPVDALVPAFAKAGAGAMIWEQGCKTGLVFNPATPLQWLDKPTACKI
jgi:ribulose-phosphate 3-epimerase